MLRKLRRNKIREIIYNEEFVKVSYLSKKLEVSRQTIRKDLNELEEEGILEREYGGAYLREDYKNKVAKVEGLKEREKENINEKKLIAEKALNFIKSGDNILLDAGTTTGEIAKQIADEGSQKKLNIITNAINIVKNFNNKPGIDFYLLGGYLRQKTLSLVGPQTIREMKNYIIDKAFIGVTGISLDRGLVSSHIQETEAKKSMVDFSKKVIVVADHSKFDGDGFKSFSDIKNVDVLITSNLVSESKLKKLQDKTNIELVNLEK